ncbi:MAG TPA: SDR family oxidoreductase [Verrucomicrobiae bacterium]|nr:SDR family oxidoreductase [Verrucomicrobiae bacterium]
MSHQKAFSLNGKVAVVTGGASGIGLAITQRFVESGAEVRVLDINREAAEAAVGAIGGGQTRVYGCDVTLQEEVRGAFEKIWRESRIDILVNNAGISHIGNIEQTREKDFEKVMRVNVTGFYNCMFACIPHMKANGGGVILNMASIAGSAGLADRFAYSTSKGAVISMTFSVARDYLAHNIRCNCISPARVHTPFVDGYLREHYPGREKEMFEKLSRTQPIGRMARPEEVASLALYLCSDEASFITGTDYPIDGGFMNLHG